MRARAPIVLTIIASWAVAISCVAASAGGGSYTRSATARCLSAKHVDVHEGSATSATGTYPALRFSYGGSELTLAFMPVISSGGPIGSLGQAITSAFARVSAVLKSAEDGNVVYYGSHLTPGATKLITGCLR